MLRKALFSTVAALSMFSVANVNASDRFSLGLNLGGAYPVYQPAPVVVNPYPTVMGPTYGYAPSYGYGNYGYLNPGVSLGYSNWNYRPPVARPYYGGGYGGYGGGFNNHYGHNHGCW